MIDLVGGVGDEFVAGVGNDTVSKYLLISMFSARLCLVQYRLIFKTSDCSFLFPKCLQNKGAPYTLVLLILKICGISEYNA